MKWSWILEWLYGTETLHIDQHWTPMWGRSSLLLLKTTEILELFGKAGCLIYMVCHLRETSSWNGKDLTIFLVAAGMMLWKINWESKWESVWSLKQVPWSTEESDPEQDLLFPCVLLSSMRRISVIFVLVVSLLIINKRGIMRKEQGSQTYGSNKVSRIFSCCYAHGVLQEKKFIGRQTWV